MGDDDVEQHVFVLVQFLFWINKDKPFSTLEMYPDYRRSNSIVGSHQPSFGPFPPLRPAGYGNPGGIGVNIMCDRGAPVVVQLQQQRGCGDLGAVRSVGPNAATYDGMSAAASGPSASYGHYSRAS